MKNAPQTGSNSTDTSRCESALHNAQILIDAGQPAQALHVLARLSITTDAVRNARGVCLMRLGRIDEALQLFRSLALTPGSTWLKSDLPIIYGTNFATVLLLSGRRAGCLSTLHEIGENEHPSVVRLREAIDQWRRGLSWTNWLMWKVGGEPSVPVTIPFPPGELLDPTQAPDATPPRRRPSKRAA